MERPVDEVVLYHGSYCEVRHLELKYCAKYKDFGQGFYLISSKKQAENFIKTSVKKAMLNGTVPEEQDYGFITAFRFTVTEDLNVLRYEKADADWLHCVAGHRKRDVFPGLADELSKYDIIIGKVANDQTNATIAAYMAYAYGEIGSKQADDMCISLLLPERLKDQFCFRTEPALKCLEFAGSEKLWL